MGILAGKPPFWGFLAVLGPPDPSRRRGFTSTPSGRGSQGPGRPRAVPGPCPGGLSRDPGPGDLVPGDPGPQGSPAPRGWGGPFRTPGPRRALDPGPGSPALGGFTSTPRAGAPRFPAGVAAPAGSPPRVEGDPPVRGPRNEPKARAPRLARLLGKGDDKQTRGAPAKTVIESQKLTSNYHTSHARGPRRPGGTSAPCRPGPQTPGVPRREPRGPAARG